MATLKKQFKIGNKEIWVRQASGMERLKFETILAKVYRKFKHYGVDQEGWTDDQQEQFLDALEEAGGGMTNQLYELVPQCIMDEIDINLIDRDELMQIYSFVSGNDEEGSVPLDL